MPPGSAGKPGRPNACVDARSRTRLSLADVLPAALGAASISASAILVMLAGTGVATTAFFRCALALPAPQPVAVTSDQDLDNERGPQLQAADVSRR